MIPPRPDLAGAAAAPRPAVPVAAALALVSLVLASSLRPPPLLAAPRHPSPAVASSPAPSSPTPAPPSPEELARRRAELQQAEQDRAARLRAAQAASDRAAAAAAASQRIAAARVAAAARLATAEAATEAASLRVEDLTRQRADAAAALAARGRDLGPLLPLIERLSLFPTETLLAVPAPPDQALRGVLVLRGLSHTLEQDAERIRQLQATLDHASAALAAEEPRLAAAQATQAAEAAALDRQLAATEAGRQSATDAAADATRAAAADAARADGLRGVISRLEDDRKAAARQAEEAASRAAAQRRDADAEAARARAAAIARPAGPGLPPPDQARASNTPPPAPSQRPDQTRQAGAGTTVGRVTAPVVGQVIRAWGEKTDAGPATGITYQPAPAARVVSPCTGRVLFAQPFRSFGQLLIVDCGGGYDFVLAGLDRFDVQVGRAVEAGEPVGTMPAWDPRASGPRPALYMELRHDGQAVDPAPWLRARG